MVNIHMYLFSINNKLYFIIIIIDRNKHRKYSHTDQHITFLHMIMVMNTNLLQQQDFKQSYRKWFV